MKEPISQRLKTVDRLVNLSFFFTQKNADTNLRSQSSQKWHTWRKCTVKYWYTIDKKSSICEAMKLYYTWTLSRSVRRRQRLKHPIFSANWSDPNLPPLLPIETYFWLSSLDFCDIDSVNTLAETYNWDFAKLNCKSKQACGRLRWVFAQGLSAVKIWKIMSDVDNSYQGWTPDQQVACGWAGAGAVGRCYKRRTGTVAWLDRGNDAQK